MQANNRFSVVGAIVTRSRGSLAFKLGLLLVIGAIFACIADASCGCSSGTWGGADDWLNENSELPDWFYTGLSPSYESNVDETELTDEKKPITISPEDLLIDMEGDSRYVVVYTENIKIDSYLKGSVFLPSGSFIDGNGHLLPVTDLALLLGAAGISEDDSLVVYGCWSCGNPTFVFWALKYLGHQNVLILEGTIKDGRMDDWISAGLPVEELPAKRPPAVYTPEPRPELLASCSNLTDDGVLLVDARSAEKFNEEHIDGAINIEHQNLIGDGIFLDQETLGDLFKELIGDGKVVVYSERGGKASVVWCALELMGYDASLYAGDAMSYWLLQKTSGGVAENGSPSIA